MKNGTVILALLLLAVTGFQSLAGANVLPDSAIRAIGDRLAADQLDAGPNAGSWDGEPYFTGSIVMGLAQAYKRTCDPAYKGAAEAGGAFINATNGNYYGYGDEALAMAMLSSISSDSQNNTYRTDLTDFYSNIKAGDGGTLSFISYYHTGTEPSTAVFYLALHTLAAYYVDAEDKALFRMALIDYLALVDDDTTEWPVMALGVATWALARTGPMDATPVDAYGTGEQIWWLVTLADLPAMLLSHQVTQGVYIGSFYWRFDHTGGLGDPVLTRGFTEDAVFGALGLAAAARAVPSLDVDDAIADARTALLIGVNPDGTVYGHLQEDSPDMKVYAGDMLLALDGLIMPSDSNMDDIVNVVDLKKMAAYWLSSCADDCACQSMDTNGDGVISLPDFAALAADWLNEM